MTKEIPTNSNDLIDIWKIYGHKNSKNWALYKWKIVLLYLHVKIILLFL